MGSSRKNQVSISDKIFVSENKQVEPTRTCVVGNTDENVEELATSVKFQRSVTLLGGSTTLSLLGIGFREKKFAIIGVKVYAAGLYMNESILTELTALKGKSSDKSQAEKSLQIVLVRDVDGKTFWDALEKSLQIVHTLDLDQPF
ncbi:unnamed protein product [Eruca vesicaria subsp. sativa]|uniref:Chalcone isomerase domain-containing protein n=1 Tax=Eruca vesicaria subsp. sativa TaxID=29727 RepID=A0ABC8LI17_ERUVS|nr:unnamed protein product [Eruca vesicaria subsp. sativa]